MKTIKQQMMQMCEEFKQKFLEETGIEVVCFPKIVPTIMTLKELRKKVIEFCEEDPLDNSSRLSGLIEAKRFFCVAADNMGHLHTEIMKYMKQERTNLYNHIERHKNLVTISPTYVQRYNEFTNTLHEQEPATREPDTVDVQ